MTLRSGDLQSDSDLDSIRNYCDVFKPVYLLRECKILANFGYFVAILRTFTGLNNAVDFQNFQISCMGGSIRANASSGSRR